MDVRKQKVIIEYADGDWWIMDDDGSIQVVESPERALAWRCPVSVSAGSMMKKVAVLNRCVVIKDIWTDFLAAIKIPLDILRFIPHN